MQGFAQKTPEDEWSLSNITEMLPGTITKNTIEKLGYIVLEPKNVQAPKERKRSQLLPGMVFRDLLACKFPLKNKFWSTVRDLLQL